MKSLRRLMTGFAAVVVGLMFVVTGAFAAPVDHKVMDKKAVVVEKVEKAKDSRGLFFERDLLFERRPFVANPFAVNPFAVNPFAVNPFAISPFAVNPFFVSPFFVDPFDFDPFEFEVFDFDRDDD